ncbi:uncharacterized protein LACBIDRAFT_306651 [Laccaria bicolor S238N-H82]|uniref:Predicted protein n=1 Tax=Laccaria bicolor (strain S238N-H82 / ATCC MYA-4686) TaxID=486041 RepID=B0DNH8_LACBS|nr:uncharacterized protein LACBIDRAFT_306651 [Laccaria bicolor S238N-H82]EDR03873.1 predicted protein [Laccaria bicolor S238N-H82]|eukprot:XP_001885441.1 predicted protein [Laccaria bicolor S238N-H82]
MCLCFLRVTTPLMMRVVSPGMYWMSTTGLPSDVSISVLRTPVYESFIHHMDHAHSKNRWGTEKHI